MAIDFKNTKGRAIKNTADAYVYTDNDNKVRIFGGVLPRYLYWLKSHDGKNIPVECLAFNRVKEKFDNAEIDYVPQYFPDKKCQWSYVVNCIDPKDGKAKVLNLKKKLFEAVITAAEDLGDPTDPETGWDLIFRKTKTGPLPFNVEYTLQVLKCKPRALTDEERATIAAAKSIDELVPRPTPNEVKATLERLTQGAPAEDAEAAAEAAEAEAVQDV